MKFITHTIYIIIIIMDELIDAITQLNISEKKIINKIIDKNDNLDNLIESFEKFNISDSENNDICITENFNKTVTKFINFFKSIKEKEKCCPKISNIIPIWTY